MILQEYFKKLDRDKVIQEVKNLYPEKFNKSAYESAWDEISKCSPVENSMIIVLMYVYDDEDVDLNIKPEEYIHVHGEDPNTPYDEYMGVGGRSVGWALEMTEWEKWLGMEVEVENPENKLCDTEEKQLAHILWEMTFMGYEETTIQDKRKEIKGRCNVAKKMIENGGDGLCDICRKEFTHGDGTYVGKNWTCQNCRTKKEKS